MKDETYKKLEEKVNKIIETKTQERDSKRIEIEKNTEEVYEAILECIANNFDADGVEIDLGIHLTKTYGHRIGYIWPKNGAKISYTEPKEIRLHDLEMKLLKDDDVFIKEPEEIEEEGVLKKTDYNITLSFEQIKNMLEKQKEKQSSLQYHDQEKDDIKKTVKFLKEKAKKLVRKQKKEDQ